MVDLTTMLTASCFALPHLPMLPIEAFSVVVTLCVLLSKTFGSALPPVLF